MVGVGGQSGNTYVSSNQPESSQDALKDDDDDDLNPEKERNAPGKLGRELGLHGLRVVHRLVLQPRDDVAHRPLPPHWEEGIDWWEGLVN